MALTVRNRGVRVSPERFERPTYGFEARRSIQLSYGPVRRRTTYRRGRQGVKPALGLLPQLRLPPRRPGRQRPASLGPVDPSNHAAPRNKNQSEITHVLPQGTAENSPIAHEFLYIVDD